MATIWDLDMAWIFSTPPAEETAKPGRLSFVESDCGEHAWLQDKESQCWVGVHRDREKTWIDFRDDRDAVGPFPRVAIVVPRDGSPTLQVNDSVSGCPIVVDIVEAAKLINRILGKQ